MTERDRKNLLRLADLHAGRTYSTFDVLNALTVYRKLPPWLKAQYGGPIDEPVQEL